ncbi:MAG TPA: Hpt domain-containing protein [Nannocystis exedens]|nr:Hpt domain-containing protein [Nannocystis exedens]
MVQKSAFLGGAAEEEHCESTWFWVSCLVSVSTIFNPSLVASADGTSWTMWAVGGLCVLAVLGIVVVLFRQRKNAETDESGVPSVAAAKLEERPESGPKIFDRVAAFELCGEDQALLESVLADMPGECASQVEVIQSGLRDGDAALVHVAAHRMKGSLMMIAAAAAAGEAAKIEELARAGELVAVPLRLEALKHELQRLARVLRGQT